MIINISIKNFEDIKCKKIKLMNAQIGSGPKSNSKIIRFFSKFSRDVLNLGNKKHFIEIVEKGGNDTDKWNFKNFKESQEKGGLLKNLEDRLIKLANIKDKNPNIVLTSLGYLLQNDYSFIDYLRQENKDVLVLKYKILQNKKIRIACLCFYFNKKMFPIYENLPDCISRFNMEIYKNYKDLDTIKIKNLMNTLYKKAKNSLSPKIKLSILNLADDEYYIEKIKELFKDENTFYNTFALAILHNQKITYLSTPFGNGSSDLLNDIIKNHGYPLKEFINKVLSSTDKDEDIKKIKFILYNQTSFGLNQEQFEMDTTNLKISSSFEYNNLNYKLKGNRLSVDEINRMNGGETLLKRLSKLIKLENEDTFSNFKSYKIKSVRLSNFDPNSKTLRKNLYKKIISGTESNIVNELNIILMRIGEYKFIDVLFEVDYKFEKMEIPVFVNSSKNPLNLVLEGEKIDSFDVFSKKLKEIIKKSNENKKFIVQKLTFKYKRSENESMTTIFKYGDGKEQEKLLNLLNNPCSEILIIENNYLRLLNSLIR